MTNIRNMQFITITSSTFLLILQVHNTYGWVIPSNTVTPKPPQRYRAISSLHESSSSNTNIEEEEDQKKNRMEVIRSLQNTFYSSSGIEADEEESDKKASLDLSTGVYSNVPLWRVQWTELPGRSNVLHVHDPAYTNMFENILHSSPPYYFGHLYLERGSKILTRKDENRMEESRLVNFKEYDMGEHGDGVIGSAVLGTLMRITDYRRIDDGRLLLLVQAMERFVVLGVHQELPYGVVDVQLLPDMEEVYDKIDDNATTIPHARALALRESLDTYLPLEFENTTLSLPMDVELSSTDILASSIMDVLPYARYSPIVTLPPPITTPKSHKYDTSSPPLPQNIENTICSNQTSLEYKLKKTKITNQPYTTNNNVRPEEQLLQLSTNELEIELWITINQYLQETSKPVSIPLLSLLPQHQELPWPTEFTLDKILDTLTTQEKAVVAHLPDHYPSYRRQKRFSFCAGLLLENVNERSDSDIQLFRHTLLRIPGIHGRLMYLIQCFQEKLFL